MKRGATRLREFDYGAREREKVRKAKTSALGGEAYGKLWSIVDGSVADALKNHPDYLTPKGLRSARTSIVKRVTGTVIGFANQASAEQSATKGRSNPADTAGGEPIPHEPASASLYVDAGAGAYSSVPTIHRWRIRREGIRLKRHVGPVSDAHAKAKIVTTAALMQDVAQGRVAR